AGAWGTYFYIGRQGSTDIEQWSGQQLVGVIENQINPQVTFGSLDYQAPYTVVIDKLALTSAGRALIHVDRAVLELAEIPQRDKPILIQKIELTSPHVLLAQNRSGGLVGWGNFVKPRPDRQAAPPGRRPSDVLRLRHVGIRDGQLV